MVAAAASDWLTEREGRQRVALSLVRQSSGINPVTVRLSSGT
jgi:hypothetical protein